MPIAGKLSSMFIYFTSDVKPNLIKDKVHRALIDKMTKLRTCTGTKTK